MHANHSNRAYNMCCPFLEMFPPGVAYFPVEHL